MVKIKALTVVLCDRALIPPSLRLFLWRRIKQNVGGVASRRTTTNTQKFLLSQPELLIDFSPVVVSPE